jgi:hypothetical protein
MNKEQFYHLLFGDNAEKIIRKENLKELYNKMHHQNDVELIKGDLWYASDHVFSDFDLNKWIARRQTLDMMKI